MAIDPDPYRTLGLSRGATIDEVKRAYRRLAKIHHPDAAGEKNVPRFLAIQAAYEQLAGGIEGTGNGRRPAAAPRRPWDADPDRSDATRRAYGGRARTSSPGGAGRGPATGGPATGGQGTAGQGTAGAAPGPTTGRTRGPSAAGGPGPSPGPSAHAGPAPRSGPKRSSRTGGASADGASGTTGTTGTSGTSGTAGRPPRPPRERKRNKATLGSTSYDGVDGPFEPDWRGASWYGTTSGTYWTLNPKEYADPRKHGPEYQARARRATRARNGGAPEPAQGEAADTDAAGATAETTAGPERPGPDAAGGPAQPTHTTSSWWESTAGPVGPEPAAAAAGAATAAHTATTPAPPPPDLGRAAADVGRALTDPNFGGQRGRVVRAFIGWLPIAFGVAWFVGEITGCGRFAATCDGFADPLVLVLQVASLGVLLLVPSLASIATMGSIALLTAAVVAALILSATGGAADGDSRRNALGAVLVVAWLVGIAYAVARRLRPAPSPTRPVS